MTDVANEWASHASVQPSNEWWRPTRQLATWLTWLFAVQAVLQLANVFVVDNAEIYVRWHDAFDALLDGRDRTAQRIFDDNPGQSSGLSSLAGFIGIAALVLLIVWMWRSAHNARALGRTGARLSPGWAIGAWFIPFANFVIPVLIMQDLWRGATPSTPRGDPTWRSAKGSWLIGVWWAAWLVSLLRFGASNAGLHDAASLDDIQNSNTVALVGVVATAIAAVLAAFVVWTLSRRQLDTLRAQRAAYDAATDAPAPG